MSTADLSKKLTFHNLTTAHMQPTLQNLLKNHTLEQLKEKCRSCGLKVSGSKPELALRIREYEESLERQNTLRTTISTSTPDWPDVASRLLSSRDHRASSAPNILMTNHKVQLRTQPITPAPMMNPVFSRDFINTPAPAYTPQPNKRERAFSAPDPTSPVDKKYRKEEESSTTSSPNASPSSANSALTDHSLSSMLEKARRIFLLEGMQPPHPLCPVG